MQIYDDIYRANNYLNDMSPYSKTIKYINSISQIAKPKLFSLHSFPPLIRNQIDNHSITEITYSFSLFKREIKIYFILENEKHDIKLDEFDRYVNSMILWLYILHCYAPRVCVKMLNIYIYMTSLLKQLPNKQNEILNEINVNTAFTSSCPTDAEIIIFRREEWFKVFIHESFHTFGLDFSNMNNDKVNKCILEIFDVNSKVNAYEAYTEYWAEMLNVLFCCFFELKDKKDVNTFLSNAEYLINLERKYSLFQLVKTLNYMDLNYKSLFTKTEQAYLNRENYKENTNVLSYYILKTILLNNFQEFLHWCDKHNYSLYNFNKTIHNQLAFCEFIRKNYKTKRMLENIEDTELFLSKLENKKRKKQSHSHNQSHLTYILINMRMSICEYG
jgi:hypothetical protein